ncbi:MAG: hypothetical protein R6U98_36675 [Pirellulaceae bacterium]
MNTAIWRYRPIDGLFRACIRHEADEMHLVVGRRPAISAKGKIECLEAKPLEPEDTLTLVKMIAPERCLRDIRKSGTSDFEIAFGDDARFYVSVSRQGGGVNVILRPIAQNNYH